MPHRIIWSWYTGRWRVFHLVQRRGDWAGPQPDQTPLRCIKCVLVTVHPSTASVPTIVLLYNGMLLCRLTAALKGLKYICISYRFWDFQHQNNGTNWKSGVRVFQGRWIQRCSIYHYATYCWSAIVSISILYHVRVISRSGKGLLLMPWMYYVRSWRAVYLR